MIFPNFGLMDWGDLYPSFRQTQRIGRNSFRYRPSHQEIAQKKNEYLEKIFHEASKEKIREVLEQKIDEFAESMGGGKISLSFYDLKDTMAPFNINGGQLGWSASTIKVPVMIEVLRAFDRGELSPAELLVIDHRYTLENFDPVSRMPDGGLVTIRDLVNHMIVVSDNEATNMLANRVGLEKINQTMQELGATQTMMAHLLAYKVPRITNSWNSDGSNFTTANDLTTLMTSIYKDTAASAQSCKVMRTILEKESEGLIGRYLPMKTRIGNKVGMITDSLCGDDVLDVGVVNGDYALAIMCNRVGKQKISPQKNEVEAAQLAEQWEKIQKILEELHRSEDLPFYFEVQAHPVFYHKNRSPGEVIGIISKVIHEVYYKGKVESFKK